MPILYGVKKSEDFQSRELTLNFCSMRYFSLPILQKYEYAPWMSKKVLKQLLFFSCFFFLFFSGVESFYTLLLQNLLPCRKIAMKVI